MARLFGTDGIRGEVNTFLTAETAFRLGAASAWILTKAKGGKANIVIGMDTRASCGMLEAAFASGAAMVGADVWSAGVIPTPALSVLIKAKGYDAGCVISASHNSCEDNGLKLFDRNGFKLPDSTEDEIERVMTDEALFAALPRPVGTAIGRCRRMDDGEAEDVYLDFLKRSMVEDGETISLEGLKIALDCANGATHIVAPVIFDTLRAETFVIANEPDGGNINLDCGSTHIEALSAFVKEIGADVGLAFDGDGDRLIAVDELGNVVDGDMVMSICGNYLFEQGKLNKNTIVATVMSNAGLGEMGKRLGIDVVRVSTGDRYVLEEMLKEGYNFGGEQSGHVIFKDYATTGDGILTGLQLLKALSAKRKAGETGLTLSGLNRYMEPFPQVLANVVVPDKEVWKTDENVTALISAAQDELGDTGRVLVRTSGTENKVRVMVEGKDGAVIERLATDIAEAIRKL